MRTETFRNVVFFWLEIILSPHSVRAFLRGPNDYYIDFEVRIISGGLVELVGPSMDDRVTIELVHGAHEAILEFRAED